LPKDQARKLEIRWSDRLPLTGWLGLMRYDLFARRAFWARAMLLELIVGLVAAGLYWWEVDLLALEPIGAVPSSPAALHMRYLAHMLLFGFMLVASMIDLDEFLIPDSVTMPGTFLALALATLMPAAMLPVLELREPELLPALEKPLAEQTPAETTHLQIASPNPWPKMLDGFPRWESLAIGLACWWGWCFALMHWVWRPRLGLRLALLLFWRRLRRSPSTRLLINVGWIGSGFIAVVWGLAAIQAEHWRGLLTALVGMAVGGGIIWCVRILGTWVLRREAMGFGDATLMAMIGAFLGWQPTLFIFFIAPFAGLVLGIFRGIFRLGREMPYGPFLCLATVVVVVRWRPIWERTEVLFIPGFLVPVVIAVCLVLLIVLLGGIQGLKALFARAVD
jgi:prepilin signal peptidase PulO-like enzyme (type II secretory pathway)